MFNLWTTLRFWFSSSCCFVTFDQLSHKTITYPKTVSRLLEYAPLCIDVAEVETILNSNACVRQVEKLHIWTITSTQVAVPAHVIVESLGIEERDKLQEQLQTYLIEKFSIYESTLQMRARISDDKG